MVGSRTIEMVGFHKLPAGQVSLHLSLSPFKLLILAS
jgi:hypothetical protein